MRMGLKQKLFRGFADPSRLKVLEGLLDGPRCVSELVKATRLRQSNLSMHLACLRDCGLVHSRRNGRFVYYELANSEIIRLLQAAERLLARVSQRIEACPRYQGDSPSRVQRGKAKR